MNTAERFLPANVSQLYSVEVETDFMYPAFRPGNKVLVEPTPPTPSQDVLFWSWEPYTNAFEETLRELVAETDEEWIVRHHNPPEVYRFQKADYPIAHTVVGMVRGYRA